jgi:cytochrome P450
MLVDPDFVPFQPPPRPLGLRGLPTIWRNYIETIPQPAYEQGVTRVRTRYSDVLLVCEPDVIGEILVEKADAFGRDPATRRSFKPVVGENSIFVAEGAEWRWQRRAAVADLPA